MMMMGMGTEDRVIKNPKTEITETGKSRQMDRKIQT